MAELASIHCLEQYRLVDDTPEVANARSSERSNAEALLESRRLQYETTGVVEYQPVDALSTANKVLDAQYTHGEDSLEYETRFDGLVLDCQRLVGEWYRKKKPEYFEPIRHMFDADSEEFFSHGLSIRQMTDNALTPIEDSPEDEARRINERVEEATPHLLRKLGHIALGEESIRTISECTDKAIVDYQSDMKHGAAHRGYNGYVPEIEKVMIRDIWLDTETDDRFEEQIGLPGTYITHEIIQLALNRKGVDAWNMDKTELHGSQLIVKDDLLSFVALLDTVASEEWCVPVFMGEVVDHNQPKEYETFRTEALARQESLKDLALTTANFVLDLAKSGFDTKKAPAHVESFVKKLLLNIAKTDYAVAEQMFDTKTAQGLQKVALLEREGLQDAAVRLLRQVETEAPGGGFCGAGSCGLESVNLTGETGKQLLKDLKANGGDTVVKDTERACKCGSKSIVYAYSKSKVNKLCQSCGSFESKRTTGSSTNTAQSKPGYAAAA